MDDVATALVRQWELIAKVIPRDRPDETQPRRGWRNAEVLAHLYVQPHLVVRFLHSVKVGNREMGVTDNLAGTKALKDLVRRICPEEGKVGQFHPNGPPHRGMGTVLGADLSADHRDYSGTDLSFGLSRHRCVEAVVHGRDLLEPVSPRPAPPNRSPRPPY